MAHEPINRAVTLRISLPPELAEEVSSRVQDGSYPSVNELVHTALLLLLRPRHATQDSPESQRLDETLRLHAEALSLPRAPSGISEAERKKRIAELSLERELHEGVRLAPERMERILRGHKPKD